MKFKEFNPEPAGIFEPFVNSLNALGYCDDSEVTLEYVVEIKHRVAQMAEQVRLEQASDADVAWIISKGISEAPSTEAARDLFLMFYYMAGSDQVRDLLKSAYLIALERGMLFWEQFLDPDQITSRQLDMLNNEYLNAKQHY